MDEPALPRYRGVPDTGGNLDEKRQGLRLRDFVVLTVVLVLSFPLCVALVNHLRELDRRVGQLNTAREFQIQNIEKYDLPLRAR